MTLASQRFNNLYMDARKSWTWTVRDAAFLEGIDNNALQQAREEFQPRSPGPVSYTHLTPAALRDFTYNGRSELVEARISRGGCFSYRYDNIGNRKKMCIRDSPLPEATAITCLAPGTEDFQVEGLSLIHI